MTGGASSEPREPDVDVRLPSSPSDEPLRLVCQEICGGNRQASRPIELPGIRGWLHAAPCNSGAGGDLHYLSVCGSGMLSRLCLADVAGHGEAVAATSAVMHRHLRRCVNRTDQRRVLSELNARLVTDGLTQMATTAMVSYFPPTRRLTYSYAGHEPAWYYDAAADRWSRLSATVRQGLSDLPLAVDAQTRFTQTRRRVAYGDRLLVLTDGVLEAPGHDGALFGAARVQRVLDRLGNADCPTIVAELNRALHAHTDGTPGAHDDVTLLAVEFTRDDRVPALWRAIWNRLTSPRGNAAAYDTAPA